MLTDEVMAQVAPDLDPEMLAAARVYLEPIWSALDRAELPEDAVPAAVFDPVAVAGAAPPARQLPGPPADTPPPPPGSAAELAWLPAFAQAALVRSGAVTATEVVDAVAARIGRYAGTLNAFITQTVDSARAEARAPLPGRLSGVPIGVKDIVGTAGVRTTGGSRILRDRVPEHDAEAWARLKAEGALLIGKLHTHEFAAGATGENPHYGDARNPWDTTRITGGSSSGSAAAAAAALCAAALGSDTGGSIRIPAALCGVVGLKPTYGRVPTAGVYPLSWSLDHVGPIARSVRDAGLLLDILTGDASGAAERAARAGTSNDLSGWRIGVPEAWIRDGLQDGVAAAFAAALDALRGLGASVVTVSPPGDLPLFTAVNRAIALAEGSSWHAPFLRGGRAAEYGANVRPRKEAGRFVSGTDYVAAQRLRTVLCRGFGRLWDDVDLMATPTLPVVAPPLGMAVIALPDGRTLPVSAALVGAAAVFDVLGTPVVTVPCGHGADGLPAGLSLVAPPGRDAHAVYAAAAYAAATPWASERPPATP